VEWEDENGRGEMRDGAWEDGKNHGPWVSYYANGNKMSEGSYNKGKKVGR
jgi:antitoxin component YwqK of YwqJK toxin-antitoxin module